ncbi:Dihydrolipoyl dehydrogenase [Sporomusa carbonis]|uniref:dihydrolipoyl dehydrogenase n=1 Tax=Sporomusa carbonis TaxID=3076075 RepID=UPI003A64E032
MSENIVKADLAIIGGGPGGYVAAIKGAQMGAQVVLIEEDQLGGTCLNRGCIPTKALLETAHEYKKLDSLSKRGIKVTGKELDWKQALAQKDKAVATLVGGVGYLLQQNKVKVLKGHGQFIDAQTLLCQHSDGTKTKIQAAKIMIATGSNPKRIPVEGIDGKRILSSTELLNIPRLPDSLAIIGAGAVGVEFASIFHALGVKVTIIEAMPGLLPTMDTDLGSFLLKKFSKDGIRVEVNAYVQGMRDNGSSEEIRIKNLDGQEQTIEAEFVLLAAGRQANTAGLNLEAVGLKLNAGFIPVNEYMETEISGIYAIGDVTGGIMLAHVASRQGIVAVENALGKKIKIDYRSVPGCIYTHPEIASVGLTEAEASQRYDVAVHRFPFQANGRAVAVDEAEGFVKLVSDKKFGEILGIHLAGPMATELVGEAGLAITMESTVEELANTIHAHPTFNEVLMEVAHAASGQPIHNV